MGKSETKYSLEPPIDAERRGGILNGEILSAKIGLSGGLSADMSCEAGAAGEASPKALRLKGCQIQSAFFGVRRRLKYLMEMIS